MVVLHVFLLLLAMVCFLLAAIGVVMPRGNLVAAGLFCWVLSLVLQLIVH
jgi:hypothetical protein